MTVVLSNRGPYRFVEQDGALGARPGPGGVASSSRSLLEARDDVTWISAAHDETDRAALRAGMTAADGRSRLIDIDADVHRLAIDVVANQTLWFLHHGLFDLVRRPRFDRGFAEAWDAFVAANRCFAEAAAEAAPPGDTVLVQDYQLCLVPGILRALRPDLRLAHFTHTPFCGPNSVRVLPDAAARDLCTSMAAAPAGFHARRWANAYEASSRVILGDDGPRPSFVAPLGPDAGALARDVDSDAMREATRALDELAGDRALIVRVDRIDPSKNIVRGFVAYDLLLRDHPEWRERVVFVAKLNASRETLAEYLAYHREVELAVQRLEERWGTRDWRPVVLDASDDHIQALAALRRCDVLVVNPLKDGLNLVAKEGPLVNDRDGVLCLSPDAGAWDELGEAALAMHPYDVHGAAGTLHTALAMAPEERRARAERLRALAGARTPASWLDDQLSAAR